jgi:hypothetical protein
MQKSGFSKVPLPLAVLLGQDMTLEGLVPTDLSGSGQAEPFVGAPIRFKLWHCENPLFAEGSRPELQPVSRRFALRL